MTVGPLDLVDGTPVFDIKPYLPRVDAFPEASSGWVEEVEREWAARERFVVEVSPLASRQLAYLRDEWGIDFTERAFELLSLDPSPHRTRRILRIDERVLRMACGAWRLFYTVEGGVVSIESVAKGFSDEALAAYPPEDVPDWGAQVAFAVRFPPD